MKLIYPLTVYFVMFSLSFYCLSGLDLGKIMLPSDKKTVKAWILLWLMSLALGYLAGTFILTITSAS